MGVHLTVPFGIYTVESIPFGRYRLTASGLSASELNSSDVASHMGLRMKVVEGCRP